MSKFQPLTATRAAYHLTWTPYEEAHLIEKQAATLAKLLRLTGSGDTIRHAEEVDGFSVSTIEDWLDRVHLFAGVNEFINDASAQAKVFAYVEASFRFVFNAAYDVDVWTDISPSDDFRGVLTELGGIYAIIAAEDDEERFAEFHKMLVGYAEDIMRQLRKAEQREAA